MSGRTLAAIALKVWGVVFLVGALVSVPQLVMLLTTMADASPQGLMKRDLIAMALNLGAHAAAGLALVAWAGRIAEAAIPETPPLVIDADASEAAALAFAVVGAFTIVSGLREAGPVAVSYFVTNRWLPAGARASYVWESDKMNLVRGAIELVAGLVLVAGRDGLANGWWRLRNATGSDGGGAD